MNAHPLFIEWLVKSTYISLYKLDEEVLMHNTGMEPEAVEIYCEVGDIRALGAKFTIKAPLGFAVEHRLNLDRKSEKVDKSFCIFMVI